MNKKLAAKAAEALTEPGFESRAGYCQRFVRQLVQAVYGAKYDKHFAASAAETMENFRKAGLAVKYDAALPGGGSELGDLLYKGTRTSGKFGHVAVRVAGNKAAENSSSHVSEKDREARGTRSLAAYGAWEYSVRLPE